MRVFFKHMNGEETVADAFGGASLIEVALSAGIDGIDAECGGACSCATCHVIVDRAWADVIPPARMGELDLLEILEDRRTPNSRLACQIVMAPELDGLIVQVPDTQG